MKLILLCVLFVAVTYAEENNDPIVNESNVEYNGKFHSHYELRDGSKSTQEGVLKEVHSNVFGESIKGQYSFVADDGQEYAVSYIADENGFQPVGKHLPTPPPVPESVIKALQYIKDHPKKSTEEYH
ncbi:hypothetical protein ACLKA7_014237 [Drosophila subpalustris]